MCKRVAIICVLFTVAPLTIATARCDFLCMQQMQMKLFNGFKLIAKTGPYIDLAPVATCMLEMVETVHRKGWVVRDVKPDHFMTAPPELGQALFVDCI